MGKQIQKFQAKVPTTTLANSEKLLKSLKNVLGGPHDRGGSRPPYTTYVRQSKLRIYYRYEIDVMLYLFHTGNIFVIFTSWPLLLLAPFDWHEAMVSQKRGQLCAVEIYCAAKVFYCRSAIALFYVYCAVSQTLKNRPVSFDVQKWLYKMGERSYFRNVKYCPRHIVWCWATMVRRQITMVRRSDNKFKAL